MRDKVYAVEEIRQIVAPIAEKYGVERIYLFGSYAKGCAAADSDIDLRIDKGAVRGLFTLSGLRLELCDALEKEVDLLTTGSLEAHFLQRIQEDEVLLYDCSEHAK